MATEQGLKFDRKLVGPINFGDVSGGVATAYPAHSINDNQVADSLNALFEKRGFSKWPGYKGVSVAALFTKPIRGQFLYKKTDGTEVHIVVSDQKIYSVDVTAGTKTLLAAITADTECVAVNYYGKLWIVNGTDAVKIENDLSVYRIGIVAPTALTLGAANAIAGTFAAGTYDVYGTYTRQIAGTNVLDSAPFHIGSITLDGSHGIRIVKAASTDPQVTHITAWITDADDTGTYYYYGTSANTAGNFDITSAASKVSSLLLYQEAASNQIPASLTYIYAYAGRMWGLKASDNRLYYSQYMQNAYDLEKWATQYYIPTIPHTIYSIHGIGGDLSLNTVGGMYRLAKGDTTAKPEPVVSERLYFPKNNVASVCEYNDALYGVTNDGFRIFNGTAFSIDLSKHIKPQIDILTRNSTNFPPHAVIFRRSGRRTEYQVSYNDDSISTSCHNRKLVLNMDKITVSDNTSYLAPWEIVQGGFKKAVVTADNALYVAQSLADAGIVAGETGTTDIGCLDDTGAFLTVATPRQIYVRTRTLINELAGTDTWKRIYILTQLSVAATLRLVIPDRFQYMTEFMFESTGGADLPILDGDPPVVLDDNAFPFVLPADNPLSMFDKMPIKAKGNALYLEVLQTADDRKFFMFEIQAYGFHDKHAFN